MGFGAGGRGVVISGRNIQFLDAVLLEACAAIFTDLPLVNQRDPVLILECFLNTNYHHLLPSPRNLPNR